MMRKGAEVLVKTCASVRRNEEVVIVTDEERMVIGTALADMVREVGVYEDTLI